MCTKGHIGSENMTGSVLRRRLSNDSLGSNSDTSEVFEAFGRAHESHRSTIENSFLPGVSVEAAGGFGRFVTAKLTEVAHCLTQEHERLLREARGGRVRLDADVGYHQPDARGSMSSLRSAHMRQAQQPQVTGQLPLPHAIAHQALSQATGPSSQHVMPPKPPVEGWANNAPMQDAPRLMSAGHTSRVAPMPVQPLGPKSRRVTVGTVPEVMGQPLEPAGEPKNERSEDAEADLGTASDVEMIKVLSLKTDGESEDSVRTEGRPKFKMLSEWFMQMRRSNLGNGRYVSLYEKARRSGTFDLHTSSSEGEKEEGQVSKRVLYDAQTEKMLRQRHLIGRQAHALIRRRAILYHLSSYVVRPSATWRLWWDVVASFLIGYEAIVIPLQFLDLDSTGLMKVASWIIRFFWTFDLPLSMFTGYMLPDGRIEQDFEQVAKRYMTTWFGIDASMVTVDWVEILRPDSGSLNSARMAKIIKTLRMLKMVRLGRLLRVNKLPAVFRSALDAMIRGDVTLILFNIIKIVLMVIWINHVIACCWYGILIDQGGGDLQSVPKTFDLQREANPYTYLTIFHRSLVSFAGDFMVYSHTFAERIYSVGTLLFAFVASASVVSSITSSMTRLEIATAQDSRRLSALKRYLLDNNISGKVALRVQRNAMYALLERRRNTPEENIELLNYVSEPLRVELRFEISSPVLQAHPFFRAYVSIGPFLMRQVCNTAILRVPLSKGDVLFTAGELPTVPRMYFLAGGKMKYTNLEGKSTTVVPGKWACEATLWTEWMHCGMMRAKMECMLVALSADDFRKIVITSDLELCYPHYYGKSFIKHLNSLGEHQLTDLEDPDMDIDEMVQQAHPDSVQSSSRSYQRQGSPNKPKAKAKLWDKRAGRSSGNLLSRGQSMESDE